MKLLLERLTRFFLLGEILLFNLRRRRADQVPVKISKVVVVLTGKLGDIVCGTPVLRALRRHLPQTKIIVAGKTKLQQAVLADSGLVDGYLDLHDRGARKLLKVSGAQVAIITGPSFLPTALCYLAGIPLVIAARVVGGTSPAETRLYKILQKHIKTFPYQIGAYAPRERLNALLPLGIVSDDTTKQLGFSTAASAKVERFFLDNSIDWQKDFVVAVSPTAGNQIKEWPEERFAAVADHLALNYRARIIILGGPNDKKKVEETLRHLDPAVRGIGTTHFNLDEVKALISKIHLFVSVDTGPLYIAEAFGIPTVDITGPIDENEQPPIGPRHRIVVPPNRKKPELFVLDSKSYNYDEAVRQVNSISVGLVIKEVDSLMKELKR